MIPVNNSRRIITKMEHEFTIVLEPAEEGGFIATVPEVPGAVSEGETIEEARAMVLDAVHELTMARRESALKNRGNSAQVERVPLHSNLESIRHRDSHLLTNLTNRASL